MTPARVHVSHRCINNCSLISLLALAVPLEQIHELHSPAMRDRHWKDLLDVTDQHRPPAQRRLSRVRCPMLKLFAAVSITRRLESKTTFRSFSKRCLVVDDKTSVVALGVKEHAIPREKQAVASPCKQRPIQFYFSRSKLAVAQAPTLAWRDTERLDRRRRG